MGVRVNVTDLGSVEAKRRDTLDIKLPKSGVSPGVVSSPSLEVPFLPNLMGLG